MSKLGQILSSETLATIQAIAKRTDYRRKDAARKRHERAMNKALGRRSDGSVIRPIAA